MSLKFLMRLSRLARRRHSPGRFYLLIGAIAAAWLIGGIEWMGWWPEALTLERQPKFRP